VLVLSVLRLGWRLVNPVPPLPAGMNPALAFLARATHVLLYALIVLIPLTGWIMVSASPLGNPTQFFFLFDWPNLPFFAGLSRAEIHPWHETFETVHVFLAWSAIVLIPLHLGGALYHGLLRRDDVLKRMIPGSTLGTGA
jgi:cytochrome b561